MSRMIMPAPTENTMLFCNLSKTKIRLHHSIICIVHVQENCCGYEMNQIITFWLPNNPSDWFCNIVWVVVIGTVYDDNRAWLETSISCFDIIFDICLLVDPVSRTCVERMSKGKNTKLNHIIENSNQTDRNFLRSISSSRWSYLFSTLLA